MDVTLSPDVQRFVEEEVRAGHYASPADAVNELLTQAKAREEDPTSDDVEELRAAVDEGIEDAKHGRLVSFTAEDVMAERRAARQATRKDK